MTWAGAAPVFAVGIVVVLLPGVLVGLALRLRGTVLLGLAPALSISVVAGTALAAPFLDVSFSPKAVAAGTVVVAAVGGALVALGALARRFLPVDDPAPAGRAPRAVVPAVVGGTVVAAVLAGFSVVRGLGRPDVVSQSFDALFHLNVVRWVLDSGDASPFGVLPLTSPESSPSAFYPTGWHALTALVAQVGGPFDASPVVAANVVVFVVAGVVWPLGCVVLAHAVVGPKPWLLAGAAVLSQGFVAFPWLIDRWGVLWPQVLGTAVAAPFVGLAVMVVRPHRDAPRAPFRLLLAAALVALGCGLAHPGSALLAGLLVVVFALVSGLPALLLPWRGTRHQWWTAAWVALAVLVAAAGTVVVWPRLAAVGSGTDWPATRSVGAAVLEELRGAPAGAGGSAVVAVLVLIGLVVAARRLRWRWLAVGHVVLVTLDVFAASVDSGLSQQLTGFWYNDRYRLAATVPVTGVVLAVLGAGWLARTVTRRRARAGVAVLVVAVLAGTVPQVRGNGDQLGLTNARAAEEVPESFVSLGEQRFLEDLREYVPVGDVVVGDPWDGSSFAYALGGVEVLYPHILGAWPGDWYYIADNLQHVEVDPGLCAALERTRVRWVLDDGPRFDPSALTPGGFTAFADVPALPGLEEVASGGGVTLYRITACG